MANTFKVVFSSIAGMVDIDSPAVKLVDEAFDQSPLPTGLEVAALFNPFHDHEMKHYLEDYFLPKKCCEIFMDSGGFQIITGKLKGGDGKKEQFKEKVYKLMAKYADYAFCFDENPIDANRIYHHERVLPAARETNKNIKTQLKVLDSLGGHAKVFAIFHCKEDERLETAEVLLDGIDLKRLGGVALNSLVWGGSNTLDFGKVAYFNEIKKLYPDIPNFLHLLSYGEMKLVVPFIVLQRMGYMGGDNIISADSTSYTVGHRRWGFIPLLDGSAKRVSAEMNPKAWKEFQNYYVSKYPDISERAKTCPHTHTKLSAADSNIVSPCYMLVAKKAYTEMWKDPIDFAYKYKYLNEPQIKSLSLLAKTDDFQGYVEWRNEFNMLWDDRKRGNDSIEKSKVTLDAFF